MLLLLLLNGLVKVEIVAGEVEVLKMTGNGGAWASVAGKVLFDVGVSRKIRGSETGGGRRKGLVQGIFCISLPFR